MDDFSAVTGGEWSDVVSAPRLGGLQLIRAQFITHAFPLHAHVEYVMGAVTAGAKTMRSGSRTWQVGPGDLTLFNPYEDHASRGVADGWRYVALYPTPQILRTWFGDLDIGASLFDKAVVSDRAAAAAIARLHAELRAEPDPLAAQSVFVDIAGQLFARHGKARFGAVADDLGLVKRLRERLDEDLIAPLALDDLSSLVDLSPVGVLRAFRKAVGCTPHVYRTARRIASAKAALGAGEALADIAADTGFCDQSHFTRVFHRWTGVTPGAFARSQA